MSNPQARFVVAFAAAVVTAVALTAPAPSHAAYVLTEISVAGADNTAVWDINNSGTMVGFSYASSAPNYATAFIRSSSGSFSTLTGPAGAISTNAMGISDTGRVAPVALSSSRPGGRPGPSARRL